MKIHENADAYKSTHVIQCMQTGLQCGKSTQVYLHSPSPPSVKPRPDLGFVLLFFFFVTCVEKSLDRKETKHPQLRNGAVIKQQHFSVAQWGVLFVKNNPLPVLYRP